MGCRLRASGRSRQAQTPEFLWPAREARAISAEAIGPKQLAPDHHHYLFLVFSLHYQALHLRLPSPMASELSLLPLTLRYSVRDLKRNHDALLREVAAMALMNSALLDDLRRLKKGKEPGRLAGPAGAPIPLGENDVR